MTNTDVNMPTSTTLYRLDKLGEAVRAWDGSSMGTQLMELLRAELAAELCSEFNADRVLNYFDRTGFTTVSRCIQVFIEA